ncbi:hypothetical protein D3C81_1579090 [compost metagenome]
MGGNDHAPAGIHLLLQLDSRGIYTLRAERYIFHSFFQPVCKCLHRLKVRKKGEQMRRAHAGLPYLQLTSKQYGRVLIGNASIPKLLHFAAL